MMPNRVKYTPIQDSYILRYYGVKTASQIGAVLGVSRCCVIGRHWRLMQGKKKDKEIAVKSFKDYLDEIN